jgi:hypothetical protein
MPAKYWLTDSFSACSPRAEDFNHRGTQNTEGTERERVRIQDPETLGTRHPPCHPSLRSASPSGLCALCASVVKIQRWNAT